MLSENNFLVIEFKERFKNNNLKIVSLKNLIL